MLKQFARGLLIAVLALLLVGFGLCGLFGTVTGLHDGLTYGWSGRSFASAFVQFGLAGLAIAAVCGFVLFKLRRRRPPADQSSAQ